VVFIDKSGAVRRYVSKYLLQIRFSFNVIWSPYKFIGRRKYGNEKVLKALNIAHYERMKKHFLKYHERATI